MSSWLQDAQIPFTSYRLQGKSAVRIAVRVAVGVLIWSLLLVIYRQSGPRRWGRPFDRDGRPHKMKVAFAVLLSPNYNKDVEQDEVALDDYFLATRVLNYQLRHSIKTRYHDPDVPLLVMCPPPVAENKRKILEKEGATIVPVEYIREEWIQPPLPQWDSMMSKLWLWTYTKYDRILYLDADMLLVDSLDGIFEDAAAQEYNTDYNKTNPEDKRSHLIPPTYVMGGVLDGVSGDREHPAYQDYMNAGFFMMKPDLGMFNLFMDYVHTENSFSLSMMEQNLINLVFASSGPMHWQRLDEHWDTSCPTPKDIDRGWKTLHGKYWALSASPCDVDPRAGRLWYQTLGQMETFYAGGRPL